MLVLYLFFYPIFTFLILIRHMKQFHFHNHRSLNFLFHSDIQIFYCLPNNQILPSVNYKIRDFHFPEHPYQIRKYLFNSLNLRHIFETLSLTPFTDKDYLIKC